MFSTTGKQYFIVAGSILFMASEKKDLTSFFLSYVQESPKSMFASNVNSGTITQPHVAQTWVLHGKTHRKMFP